MDNYSKTMLTIIAIFLGAITLKLWQPAPVNNITDSIVTTGTVEKLMKLPEAERAAEFKLLNSRIPLVRITGETEVYGSVRCRQW